MPHFTIEIPVRITRQPEFAVDHEPTQECAVKFSVEAEDEEEALELVQMLIFNEINIEDMEEDTSEAPS